MWCEGPVVKWTVGLKVLSKIPDTERATGGDMLLDMDNNKYIFARSYFFYGVRLLCLGLMLVMSGLTGGYAQIMPSPDVHTVPEHNEWRPRTPHYVPGLPYYLPSPGDYERVSVMSQWEVPPDKTVTLQYGTPIAVWLLRPLDTRYTHAGDAIEVQVSNTLYIGVDKVIEQDDTLVGTLEEVQPPIQGRNAIVKMRFTELKRYQVGSMPFNAVLKGHNQMMGGELTPGTEEKVVVHHVMGIGRYNQSTLGGQREMGKHIQLPIGEPLTLILDSDITMPVWLGPRGYQWQAASRRVQPESSSSGVSGSSSWLQGDTETMSEDGEAAPSKASQYVRGNW